MRSNLAPLRIGRSFFAAAVLVGDAPLAAGVAAGGAMDRGRSWAKTLRRRVFPAGLSGGVGFISSA